MCTSQHPYQGVDIHILNVLMMAHANSKGVHADFFTGRPIVSKDLPRSSRHKLYFILTLSLAIDH